MITDALTTTTSGGLLIKHARRRALLAMCADQSPEDCLPTSVLVNRWIEA